MSVSQIVVWFYLGALAGWLFESAYCAIKSGHWEKRGFLMGPVCPIYGVGVAAGLLAFNNPAVLSGEFPWWGVFLVSMAASAVLEYATSYFLEQTFDTVWWDYRNMPLNLNGRICLPASLLFGLGGLAVAYCVLPVVLVVDAALPAWLFEIAALVVVAGFAADGALTLTTLADLLKKVTDFDESFNRLMEEKYQNVDDAARAASSLLKEKQQAAFEHADQARENAVSFVQNLPIEQRGRVDDFARSLSLRQRYLIRHMRRFRSAHMGDVVARLRVVLEEAAEKVRRNG